MADPVSCLTFRRIAALLLPMLLGACGIFTNTPPPAPPPPKIKHVRHQATLPELKLAETIAYPPEAYLLHLSLAELTLEAKPSDVFAAAADLDIARAYSGQVQEAPVTQPVIALEYSVKGQVAREHIVIPFDPSSDAADFPELQEAMLRLNALSFTLYDLKSGTISLTQPLPLGDEGDSAAAALEMIGDRLQPFARSVSALPPATQARVYLNLTRFFMKHQYREPAYLAIDNAKQALAGADTSSSGDLAASRNLSREIDAQESLLRKTMPFTLGF